MRDTQIVILITLVIVLHILRSLMGCNYVFLGMFYMSYMYDRMF